MIDIFLYSSLFSSAVFFLFSLTLTNLLTKANNARIGNGLMILVGISVTDTKEDAEKLSRKIVAQRLFQEGDAHWKKSVKDTNGDILSVSQFTLMAKTTKGSKPDFHRAQKGHVAKDLYNYFLECLKKEIGDESKIKDGQFGAMMQVALTNE